VRVGSLDHLVVTVADIEATVAFYEKLGMQAVQFGEGRVALRFGDQKLNLHRAGEEVHPHARRPQPGSADLCFLVDGDAAGWEAHLAEAGIPIELGPVERTGATGPICSLYVRDPDENLIELSTHLNAGAAE
jgi:catechol 2,3-dioxygenase-like lactoylglutathione lyase family enzyme